MKHYKLYYATIGLVVASIIGTGIYMGTNKKNSKNDSPAPDNQITNENPTLDEVTQNRIDTMKTIYNFVDEMNSTKALNVDGKTLMFTMEEGSALYVNLNNLTKEEFCNLYGNSDANYEDIKSAFESAMLKLKIYFARSTQTSSVSGLITDEASKEFFSTYEDLHVDYNNLPVESRKDAAKAIIAQFKTDYINGSNLPYNDVNPGVARLVLATFQEGDQIGWANSSIKFPEDINKILEETVEPDLCSTTNDNLEELVDSLGTLQITNKAVNGTTSEGKNSYTNLLNGYIADLTMDGHYSSVDTAIDADNPDIFNNSNGKVSEASDKSSNNAGSKSGDKKSEKESGKDLSSEDMDKVIDKLPEDTKDSAEDQKDAIDGKYEDQNDIEVKKAEKFKKGYNHTYKNAYDSAFEGASKLTYFNTDVEDIYNKAYFEGCNKGIDDGYADGMRDRKKAAETTSEVTPTTGATTGTSSNDSSSSSNGSSSSSNGSDSSSNNNGGSTTDDGVSIDDDYIDENGDPKFDGPIYDENGKEIGKASIRQDAIAVLCATRDAIIATACISDSNYNESKIKKYNYMNEYNRGICL